MHKSLVLCFLLACAFPAFGADKGMISLPLGAAGTVTILNMRKGQVNSECLLQAVKEIVDRFDRKELIPFRVKISKDHTIVKEALSGETISFERVSGKGDSIRMLIPVKYKGERIIVSTRHGQAESYEMLGLPDGTSGIDFSACFN